jgi:uncharacterized membrane protein
MEAVMVILLLVMFFVMIGIKNTISNKFEVLREKIDALSAELKKHQSQIPPSERKASAVKEEDLEAARYASQMAALEEEAMSTEIEEAFKDKSLEKLEVIQTATTPSDIQDASRPPIAQPPKQKKPGFFERNPDLEKFIGENLANKIGIGILVLGIGFFVKYAIDQNWIGEIGRVFIGILCGGILLGVAHKLRKTFTAFSSVLVGGGLAVLYLTIAIAFHEYQIFSQTAAFVIMVVITAFAVVLSLGYNRIELAVLAILGGFASPFMVSTGEGNYVVLFTYIFILDVGMLVLAYYKKWNLVNIVAYVFTVILFAAWLVEGFDYENVSKIWGGLLFATMFYVVFFAMNIINNVKNKAAFESLEITLLLSNTFFYYAAGMVILNNESGELYKGLFTAALGVFNFVFAFILHRSGRVDKNLVFLLIGLVLTFISLAAPIQLEGNHITLFWSAEAVLLLWLSQKSGIRLMKLASVAITGLMIISLIMDWQQLYVNYEEELLTIIFNKAYITSVVALASLAGTLYLLKFEGVENAENVRIYKTALKTAVIVLLYTANFLELQYQLFEHGFNYATQNIIIGSYNMAYMAGLLLISKRFTLPQDIKNAFALLGIAAMLSYMFFYQGQVITVRNDYANGLGNLTGFMFHYVLLAFLLLVVGTSLIQIRQLKEFNEKTHNLYSWFYVFFFVFMASAELDHIVVMAAYTPADSISHILSQNHKIGYPILWGVTSFALIAIGLKKKIRHLRIISLTLFLITLLKLFLVDIKGISEGGKIAAFISLGLLLLVVSFMYQRLKKLLLADAPANDSSENQGSV